MKAVEEWGEVQRQGKKERRIKEHKEILHLQPEISK